MKILPGSTIGMLGGGQLGRMFTIAARTMGYEVIVLDPDTNSPAGKLANDHICADYSDQTALDYLAKTCDVVTTALPSWLFRINCSLPRGHQKAQERRSDNIERFHANTTSHRIYALR